MMIEAGPGNGEKDPSATPTHPAYDFSVVQGFQVVGVDCHAAGRAEGWRDALRLELETRAARFHHAVDSAVVLSNDGVIRWLGDPVARLSPGPSVLTPGAVILADEALADSARDLVRARIELWLAATTRRLLGPLFALDALQEGSEVGRDLAGRLAKSLGILDREPIKGQLKALAQNDRAELRKHGVRFGAYYVFLPTLIKPAARSLALQLWSLHASGDGAALLAALAQVASSGRTSLMFDRQISKEGYRIAGYRPCGERIVRVDVIERLAGIIRGAIMESQARAALGPGGQGRSNGFVVSGQMTSLTGCAGEQFASILRSIGFRSIEMKRSEFMGSQSALELPRGHELVPQTENPEIATDSQDSPAIDGEPKAPVDPLSNSPEAPPAEPVLLDVAQADIPHDGVCSAETEIETVAAFAGPPPATVPGSEKDAELILVWRPDRSPPARRGANDKTRRNRIQVHNNELSGAGPLDGPDKNADRSPVDAPEGRRNKIRRKEPTLNLAADGQKAIARPAKIVAGRPIVPHEEKHRQTPSGRDMPRSHPASEPQRRAKVDPNSPFAKLLELRPLLEKQANKRP